MRSLSRWNKEAIGKLAGSKMTRCLIDVLFQRELAAKKLPAPLATQPTRPITNAAVIGAGVMGSGIGYSLACKSTRVLITDVAVEPLAKGFGNIQEAAAWQREEAMP